MRDKRIFARTSLGDAELVKAQGKIKGDDKHLVLLMDGITDVETLGGKIPPSVRAHLQKTLSGLLAAQFIVEVERPAISATVKMPVQVLATPAEELNKNMLALADVEIERRIELEQELEKVRAQLAQASSDQAMRATLEEELRASRKSIEQLKIVLREKQQSAARTATPEATQLNPEQQRLKDEALGPDAAHTTEHLHALRGLEFFQDFAEDELQELLKIAEWQARKAGETLLREGDAGMNFYIIASGTAEVCSKGRLLATLHRSDVFGEYSHLSGEKPVRTAQVTTTEDCELLVIDPTMLEQCPAQLRLNVAEALLRSQVRRALQMNQRQDQSPDDASDQLDFCKV